MGDLRVHFETKGGTSYLIFYEKGDKGVGWIDATGNIDATVRKKF